jgi:ocular albinism type 1 protein
MVTWLWTLCYAVDIKLVLKERDGKPWLYHMISWILPAILTGIGLSILYIPNAK